jgi:hypothetical protein
LPESHRNGAALLLSYPPSDQGLANEELIGAVDLTEPMGSNLMAARTLADLLSLRQSREESERAQETLGRIGGVNESAPELGRLIDLDAARL